MRRASRCTSSSASRLTPIVRRRTPARAARVTLLLTIPNQLGVDYNAHLLDSILKYVAPELGWR